MAWGVVMARPAKGAGQDESLDAIQTAVARSCRERHKLK